MAVILFSCKGSKAVMAANKNEITVVPSMSNSNKQRTVGKVVIDGAGYPN